MTQNILQNHKPSEFSDNQFWDEFFTSKESHFEWYIEFHDFFNFFVEHVRNQSARILIPGCGASNFPPYFYERNFHDVTSIDSSNVSIDICRKKYSLEYPELKFMCMDIFQNKFPRSSFDVIIDKGLFDTILCGDTDEHRKQATNYIAEVVRLLNDEGILFLCSLCQPYVLQHLLQSMESNFKAVSVHTFARPKTDSKTFISTLPIYIFVGIKGEGKASFVMPYFRDDEIFDSGSVGSAIISSQRQLLFQYYAQKEKLEHVMRIQLSYKDIVASLIIADSGGDLSNKEPYAIFYIGSTEALDVEYLLDRGVISTVTKSKYKRVCFCAFFGVPTEIWDILKGEKQVETPEEELAMDYISRINSYCSQLAPPHLPFNYQIPISRILPDYSESQLIHPVKFIEEAPFYVVDRKYENGVHRHLLFKESPTMVQTDLILHENRNVDMYSLGSEYYYVFLLAFTSMFDDHKNANVLAIGVGGGVFLTALMTYYPSISIDAVEIISFLIPIARQFFFLPTAANLSINISDGVDFIMMTQKLYDLVLIDVDNSDITASIRCPHPNFLEDSLLTKAKSILKPDGMIMANIYVTDEKLFDQVTRNLNDSFPISYLVPLENTGNAVFIGMKNGTLSKSQLLRTTFKKYAEEIKNIPALKSQLKLMIESLS